jgi:hypothetical protein
VLEAGREFYGAFAFFDFWFPKSQPNPEEAGPLKAKLPDDGSGSIDADFRRLNRDV